MAHIRKANENDIADILHITKDAFRLYQKQLQTSVEVVALHETKQDILNDIVNHTVFVAEDSGKVFGAVRYTMLSSNVAYLYRFAVEGNTSHIGAGSHLLKAVIDDCTAKGATALTLHTNAKHFSLARYYYGKDFFIHSTDNSKGYIRALFVKELAKDKTYDITPALNK